MGGKTKDRPKYQGISLPVPIIKKIADYIEDKPEFRSKAEFIKTSIIEKLDRDKIHNMGREELEEKLKTDRLFDWDSKTGKRKDRTIKLEADMIEIKKQYSEIIRLLEELNNK